jgi:uncharacterized protein
MKIHNRVRRISKFLYYKLLRTEGTPHCIALSVAIGIFAGCIIPDFIIWGQTIVAVSLAIKFRANSGTAFALTWISNPITDIFLYPAFCYIGSILIGYNLTFAYIKISIINLINNYSWDKFWELGSELTISFIVGGFVFGIIAAAIGYFISYRIIKWKKKPGIKGKFCKC